MNHERLTLNAKRIYCSSPFFLYNYSMAIRAIIKAGGKQYVVKESDEIVVDRLNGDADQDIELETLALFDDTDASFEVGDPSLKKTVKAKILESGKGEKIRVARFKSKVRYRRVKGFRPQLTKIKILTI